ncbi:MAG TPA: hypothetical protein VGJ89_08650 [Geothrix sp.]
MRRLILLALVALVAFPLSAHGRWARPRRVVVYEDSCRDSYRRWDDDRWEGRGPSYYRGYSRGDDRRYDCDDDRWEGRGPSYYRGYSRGDDRRYDCDDDRLVLRPLPRPLAPPFQGRLELWIR